MRDNGLWVMGRFIREGDGLYVGDSGAFFRGGLKGLSRTVKASGNDASVCVRYDKTTRDMEREFHRYCRVVYRAMRKSYGKEKVQDECLRVFKVVFPLLHRARTTGECGFDGLARERIRKIFESWHVSEGSVLDILLGNILGRMEEPFTEEEFTAFCDDILVVVMRIRKLTPRECGRLMGVSEEDIDVMLSCGVSRSALYKLYGNSIVSGTGERDSQGNYNGVLFNIFRKMFIQTEPDMVKGEAVQLSLF